MSEFAFTTLAAAFALACLGAFWLLDAPMAAVASFLAGWLILPVAVYPPTQFAGQLPVDIMPLALPSRMLWTKAALIPGAVCLASRLRDARRWRTLRWHPLDLAMAGFCLFPLLQGLLTDSAPAAAAQAAYLGAAWGGSWLIGRLYIGDGDGAAALLRALTWSGLALLPVAVVEAVTGPIVYQWLYGDHPYRADGAVRYLGYRPLALLENGNQYGLWIALAAVAALALAHADRRYRPAAALLVVASLASQSAGAIVLLAAGAVAIFRPMPVSRRTLLIGAAMLLAGAVGLAALIAIGGHRVVDFGIHAFRAVGRGSFPWRVSQDLKALAIVGRAPILGTGLWDWWRELSARPWDLPMLLLGQYGLVGLLLVALIGVTPIARFFSGLARTDHDRRALAIIAILALADALLNAFIFFPVLLVLGGLAESRGREAGARRTS